MTFDLDLPPSAAPAGAEEPTARSTRRAPVPTAVVRYPSVQHARLLDGPAGARARLNRDYVMSLTDANLLRTYLLEAGLWSWTGSIGTTIGEADSAGGPETWHWGWEALSSEIRGHILGHWLSAAAHLAPGDPEVSTRVRSVVAELARCQRAHRDGWVAPFPRTYLDRIRNGHRVWAPHYTIHKLLMGLWDAHAVAGDPLALEVLVGLGRWFHTWTADLGRTELDDLLDHETGGILEVWADLLGETGDPVFADLLERYDRPRFFDRLLAGEDCLTNKHANTQVPEVLGAARAYEVTGDERYRRVVEEFWRQAVTDRGTYATGGSTCGEVWQPKHDVTGRLHQVQEHCVVYNLMRLAEVLYRWTGDRAYADHWESNLLNGIWAQQHQRTGMVTYFLPLGQGSSKTWGRPTQDFWCCHGTLMQAHTRVATAAVHEDDEGLRITQLLPSATTWERPSGEEVTVTTTQDPLQGVVFGQTSTPRGLESIQHLHVDLPEHRPRRLAYDVRVETSSPTPFRLRLRLPGWLREPARVLVDGREVASAADQEWLDVEQVWSSSTLRVELPIGLRTLPQPGDPSRAALLDGPHLLAGITDDDGAVLTGGTELVADPERSHSWWWAGRYRARGGSSVRLVPLAEVEDETYTVYFRTDPPTSTPTSTATTSGAER